MKMKKMILSFGLLLSLSAQLSANSSEYHDWGDEDSNTVELSGGNVLFNYKRFDLSAKDQDRYQMKVDLAKNICSQDSLKELVTQGYTFIFNYIYKDGTITATIDSCN